MRTLIFSLGGLRLGAVGRMLGVRASTAVTAFTAVGLVVAAARAMVSRAGS